MNCIKSNFQAPLLALLLATGTSLASLCAESTWRGYITDKQCADSVREDSNPKDYLKHHTKDCALMPNCRAKGYVLYTDHQWLALDKRGNEQAIGVLKASKNNSGLYAEVTGTKKGNALAVRTIKEIAKPPTEQR